MQIILEKQDYDILMQAGGRATAHLRAFWNGPDGRLIVLGQAEVKLEFVGNLIPGVLNLIIKK
jgi:hypothetical protein